MMKGILWRKDKNDEGNFKNERQEWWREFVRIEKEKQDHRGSLKNGEEEMEEAGHF